MGVENGENSMDYLEIKKKYRSRILVEGAEKAGERAHLRSLGLLDKDLERPFVGVVKCIRVTFT